MAPPCSAIIYRMNQRLLKAVYVLRKRLPNDPSREHGKDYAKLLGMKVSHLSGEVFHLLCKAL